MGGSLPGARSIPLDETWVLAAPLSDGRWQVRCSRCRRVTHTITADGATRLVREHICPATKDDSHG
jgi:hypothetical protein